jgi:hypothetical protein
MIFLAWLTRSLSSRAHELVKVKAHKPLTRPPISHPDAQIATLALDHQALESPRDLAVDLDELVGGIASTKVIPPAAQHRG